MMRIAIVADDLTGALDAAAPFADAGLAASVLLRSGRSGDEPVLSIDTDTREAAPAAAALAVEQAFGGLDLAGVLPFKKIDSTLRGNIGPELGAALAATGRRVAIVAPAAPRQGRSLRGGWLYVDGQRMGRQSLVELLQQQQLSGVPVRPIHAGGRIEIAAGDTCVVVADAQNEEQLDAIAAYGLAHPQDVLLAGSSGLSSAVMRLLAPANGFSGPTRRFETSRLHFLIGSHHARSAEQVQALVATGDVPAHVLSPAAGDALPGAIANATRGVLVHVAGLGTPLRLDPAWIARRLGDAATSLLRAAGDEPVALFLTGGATARSILEHLGVDRIEIVGSLFPGVVHGRVTVGGRAVDVITKSGGFGERDLLVRLARECVSR
jgi:D-threonate/D-erythronate kinase